MFADLSHARIPFLVNRSNLPIAKCSQNYLINTNFFSVISLIVLAENNSLQKGKQHKKKEKPHPGNKKNPDTKCRDTHEKIVDC